MSFKLYMEQEGEGCGYYIGCGERLVDLKETDLYLAHDEALQIIRDYTGGDVTISKAYIVEIKEDISRHASVDIPKEKEEERLRIERAYKLKMLENLKRELGVK